MLPARTDRRIASVVLALLLVSVISVGAVGSVTADTTLTVVTDPATNVTETGATLRGEVTQLGDTESARVYIVYWQSGHRDSTLTWWTGEERSSDGTFSTDATLESGTTYKYRAYVQSANGAWKAGTVREVATRGRSLGVKTPPATDITPGKATLGANLTGLGGAEEATVFVKYWPKEDPSRVYWRTSTYLSRPDEFDTLVDVAPGTTYEYRALARADGEWARGSIRTFTTPRGGFDVTTTPPSSVGVESARVGGNLTSLGGTSSATVYVKYWREGMQASTTQWWTGTALSAPESFETDLALRAGTSYEYRAFARSADGRWKGGTVESLTTEGSAYNVSTPLPENVTHNSATVSAKLHGLGDADSATVYVRYWIPGRMDTTMTWWTGPTVSEADTYETSISLDPDTGYKIQALARDDAGNWIAGREVRFTTEADPGAEEQPFAKIEQQLISPTDSFQNAKPLDSNDTVTFNASQSYDPDGDVVRYEWDFDSDGTTDATGEVVTYSFPAGGHYTVELTVTDNDGNTGSLERAIHVNENGADTIHAVNAGGPGISETGHPDWAADTTTDPYPDANHAASGSRILEADSLISGHDTSEPPSAPNHMWATVREDPADGEPMRYTFSVEAGQTYDVHVFFTEVEIGDEDYANGTHRTFDVIVEGQTAVNDYDTYGELGHDGGGSETITVTADDGTLVVEFHREQGDPVVSGIEVLRVEEGS